MVTWLVAAPRPCQRARGLARGALPFCTWERGGMRASCSVSWERGPERASPWCCPHFAPEQHGCAHSLAQQPWIQTAAPGQTSTCQHPAHTGVHTGMHKACAHTHVHTHPHAYGKGLPPTSHLPPGGLCTGSSRCPLHTRLPLTRVPSRMCVCSQVGILDIKSHI